MASWVLFVAEDGEPGWEDRELTHNGNLTCILSEHFNFRPDAEAIAIGYRPIETYQVKEFSDPMYPDAATHYRDGDWVVSRIEDYAPETSGSDFSKIKVCYCRHDPIEPILYPFTRDTKF